MACTVALKELNWKYKINVSDVTDIILIYLTQEFVDIIKLTDVQEGLIYMVVFLYRIKICCLGIIVRTIQRLDETCRDVRSSAKTIGDSDLYHKMDKVSSLIKRDIVFAASLYTK